MLDFNGLNALLIYYAIVKRIDKCNVEQVITCVALLLLITCL